MVDPAIIRGFREFVNTHDWVCNHYQNIEGKNKWSCICSAMDWIEVAAKYLDLHPIASIAGDDSISFYSIIVCIDLIVEAVEQLHRVIFSTDERVFGKDACCFDKSPYASTDRDYFKELRSFFGAHPINLDNDVPNHKFASWSGRSINGKFSVFIYSNDINKPDACIEINDNQLISFATKYYFYLKQLKEELNRQFTAFCEQKKRESIHRGNTPLQTVNILLEENNNRLKNTYYGEMLTELRIIFQTEITCESNKGLVGEYRKSLIPLVDELFDNIQSMSYGDLKNDYWIMASVPNNWRYCYSKLSDSVLAGTPLKVSINELEYVFREYFTFEFSSIEELYVLVIAVLHSPKEE